MAAIDAFTDRLAGLADLGDEELTALESEIMAAFDEADTAEDTAGMEALAEALDQVRAEMNSRGETEGDAPVEASSEEPIEAAAETQTPTTASAVTVSEEDNMANDRSPKTVTPEHTNAIIASVDIPGYTAGTPFKDMKAFSDAFARRVNSLRGVRGGDGEQVIVASIESSVPDERKLIHNDPAGNLEKIEAVTELSAITAAGGFCAPLETRYDLFTIGETARPIRDSLPGFQADRGGIRFFASPTLSSVGVSSGTWDKTDDAAYVEATPGTHKVLGTVACPSELTAETQAVTSALLFGVMSSKVFPENVEANTKLALVQHARLAESTILSGIKTGSTKVTGPAVQYGAVRDILLTVARVGSWYRDRHRLGLEVPLRAQLPIWLLDLMRADLIVQPPASDGRGGDFAVSSRDIENFFDQWNINISLALDGPDPASNRGGTYGPLVDTVEAGDPAGTKDVPAFQTSAQWSLFAEGSWLFLDGGSLDLGVVRDSKQVRANDYMQFSETFEGVAKIGGESLWITSPISVRGGYTPAVTLA